MTRTCTIGLDVGTTSAKALALDEQERIVGQGQVPVHTEHDADGAARQDPNAVAEAALGALHQAALAAGDRGAVAVRIGISAAMHSIIPLDVADRPLLPALIWLDTRADGVAEALWATPEGRAIYGRTGTPIHAMSPLAKLIWLRQERAEIFARARRFVSLKEWVWRRLGGDWQVDASIASATGLYNLATGAWDEGALDLAGITPDRLAAIVPTTFTRTLDGAAASLPAAIAPDAPITIGASDGVLANLGVGAITPGIAALTIGTSAAIRGAVAVPTTDPVTRRFCYILDQGRFIAGAPSNSGGVVLEWFGQQFAAAGDLDALLRAAADRPTGEILCLPYLAGERAPIWDGTASATLHGLRLHHGPADVLRAVVEGIAMNARWLGDALPQPPTKVIASGRVLGEGWIRQIVADLFGVPVAYDGLADASALGAARLADLAAGARRWEEIAPDPRATISQPNPDSPYPALYARFRRLAADVTERAVQP